MENMTTPDVPFTETALSDIAAIDDPFTHACSQCGKCFGQLIELESHQMVHNHRQIQPSKPHACKQCSQAFMGYEMLQNHVKTEHTGEMRKELLCEQCGKSFAQANYLKKHMLSHTTRDFHCQDCSKSFLTGESLGKHRGSACGGNRGGRNAADKDNLEQAKEALIPPDVIFAEIQSIINAVEDPFSHLCSQCGECFQRHVELESHKRAHRRVQKRASKPHPCDYCRKSFIVYETLQNHIKMVHTGEIRKTFLCGNCGKGFTQANYLSRHMLSHSAKSFPCSDCMKRFLTAEMLERHRLKACVAANPGGNKTGNGAGHSMKFACSLCSKSFATANRLDSHMHCHATEKPYKCAHCSKSYTRKEDMRKHLPVHSGIKPFCCSQCGKCFTFKQLLTKHERVHSGARPYSCQLCWASFKRSDHLNTHMKTHD